MPGFLGPDSADSSFDEFLARLLSGSRSGTPGRAVDIARLLSRRTQELVQQSGEFAAAHGHPGVDALHLLHVLLTRSPVSTLVERVGADPAALAAEIEDRLPETSGDGSGSALGLLPSAQRALFVAAQIARASGSTFIDPEHVFFALALNYDAVPGQLLASAGVTPQALQAASATPTGSNSTPRDHEEATSATPTLDQYGTDLTARGRDGGLDPVIGRADEIAQTIEILLRRTKNNPVLIGEPGVGKTAIVEGLAQRIADGEVPDLLRGKRVVSLDLAGMLAGTRFRGEFEERLTKVMTEITEHKDELIVFVDELHTVVGAGGAEGAMDAGNLLKPRLSRGELHLIGATTLAEYRRIEKDAALERRFQPVLVGEPSEEDAVRILDGLKGRYEEHHRISYSDDAVRAAVELSARYIADRFLPDKAIDLLDQAGARRRLALGEPTDVAALRAREGELEEAKSRAVA
jgi:ATP-dependent Clp protease ATP-binding subunit ClpC